MNFYSFTQWAYLFACKQIYTDRLECSCSGEEVENMKDLQTDGQTIDNRR